MCSERVGGERGGGGSMGHHRHKEDDDDDLIVVPHGAQHAPPCARRPMLVLGWQVWVWVQGRAWTRLGGGYGGCPVRGLGHCDRGGGLQCGVLPLFFSFPPAFCSHICPLLSTFLNSSPFLHVCMYKVGGG